jgi:two-component system OmpR family sensor kinase
MSVPSSVPRPRSVRTQLTLWNIAVVGIALTLFGIGLRLGVHRLLLSGVDNDLERRMERFQFHARPGDPQFGGPARDRQAADGAAGGDHFPRDGSGGDRPSRDGSGDGPPPDDNRAPGDRGGNDNGPPPTPPSGAGGFPPRLLMPSVAGDLARSATPYEAEGYRDTLLSGEAEFSYGTAENGETVRVYSAPVRAADRHGVVSRAVAQVAAPVGFIGAADQGVTSTLLLLIPAALLLTGIGGATLTNRALQPIDRLGQVISRIQAQDLKERLPDVGADEFGRLTTIVNAMLGRLEDAFERQRRFAADASHELRTPLATIRASSSLALDSGGAEFTPEQYQAILGTIDRAADRAARVTQDLLFLARMGTLPVRRERVDLRAVLEEARAAVVAGAAGRPLPTIFIERGEETLEGSDRDHLLRIFINLIDNASRHTPETGRVEARIRSADYGAIAVSVADNGEGIPAEHLARICEPFYRPDNARSRRSGGAGLGLAIAQGIADALGGSLRIRSVVGQGTIVTVTLPSSSSS